MIIMPYGWSWPIAAAHRPSRLLALHRVRRMLSPLVWQRWAWCMSRSTVAVARVLGISSSNPTGVEVGADRDAAALVGGVDQAVESLGGVGADRQEPDIVDHDQVGPQDAGDGLGDRVVGAVAADQGAELLEGEPGDVLAGCNGCLAEGLEHEGLACPRRAADDEVLVAADPLQGAQRCLGGCRDRGEPLVPGIERLPGGEGGPGAAGGQRGAVAAGDLLGEQRPEDLGGIPPLGLGRGDDLGRGAPHIRQAHPAQQLVQAVVQRRRGRGGGGHWVLLAGVAKSR